MSTSATTATTPTTATSATRTATAATPATAPTAATPPALATLTLAALGIVYGDIGTTPLYAVKETFNPSHGIPLTEATIIGGISSIFWALMIIVSLKYVV